LIAEDPFEISGAAKTWPRFAKALNWQGDGARHLPSN
jgi:hypothetical protein